MRERLIELIKNALSAYGKEADAECKPQEFIADFLFVNGVIVPPVKLGQNVYTIQGQRKHPKEWKVVGIWKSETDFNFHVVCYIDGKFDSSTSMDIGRIEKSVFLTKEEAMQALKERF